MDIEIKDGVIYQNGIKTNAKVGSGRPPAPLSVAELSEDEISELFKTMLKTLEGIEWEYRDIKKSYASKRFAVIKDYVIAMCDDKDTTRATIKRRQAIADRLNKYEIMLARFPSDGKPVLAIIPTMVRFLFHHYLELDLKLAKISDYENRKRIKNLVPKKQLVAYTIAYHADQMQIDRNKLGKVWNVIFSIGDNRKSVNFSGLPYPLPPPLSSSIQH